MHDCLGEENMPLEYKNYADRVNQKRLNQQIDACNGGVSNHLITIAKDLSKLDELAAELGVKHAALRDIENQYLEVQRRRSVVTIAQVNYT